MKIRTKIMIVLCCLAMAAAAYFAWKLPFYEYAQDVYETSAGKWFTVEYVKALAPFLVILFLAAAGIVVCVQVRKSIRKAGDFSGNFSRMHMEQGSGKVKGQKRFGFMTIRWIIMIAAFLFLVYGGVLSGVHISAISIPAFFCPVNEQQLTEASCYFLAHIKELLQLPIKDILLFLVSTVGFTVLLGRMICGFLCPVGLVQDIMHAIRQKTKTEGISMTEKMYRGLVPVKWTMILLMLGLSFLGGNFCNFCPAITLSPAFAGMKVSLYVSGFMMVFVLIGSFFKRRIWCNICPLGYLIGLAHRISPFRLKKDCQACTECGACYEACPMGIKMIYTEREKTDVTDINCIMCGECVKKCPEDRALSMTFVGHGFYTASRKQVLSGYEHTEEELEAAVHSCGKKG